MIVKPSISFLTNDADSVLVSDVQSILTSMTNNPNYPTPTPALSLVTATLGAFSDALSAAAGGGVALTSAKNAKRAELIALMRQLASYTQTACNGDMTMLLSSGFPVQKPQRQPIGPLSTPTNLTLSLGAVSGQLLAKASPVTGAVIYTWQLSKAATPSVWEDAGQTTGARNSFDGLTPGA